MINYRLQEEDEEGEQEELQQENVDPYTLVVYGIRSPYTKESYFRRLRGFFDAITKVRHLRNAVIRSLTKEEVILTGHLIIS